ncbi:SipW-dependent-type signal peptide-containing protein [Rhodococcus sp. OK302]|uniref:SipW-dependent-type signal peptide-containing protein n=1 Tax=Rhodococcus sp. OK302 TaxID=1882769 RepID=UPI000B93BB43|nr:SipW-dependent-type signal peptide-containing protein [Rhodococcus sp. OK302]OYD66706.1 putative ribosomally synthesized peptide with SipW-like signal peptide [Rhodococcus sp. OK302]
MSEHEETHAPASLGRHICRGATSGRARAIMSVGMVLGLGAVGTLATWTDGVTATSGAFTTASVAMKLNGHPTVSTDTSDYAFTALTTSNILPGNSVSQVLTVQNAGDVAFKYTMTAKANGESALAPLMKVTILDQACSTVIAGPTALSTTAPVGIVAAERTVAVKTATAGSGEEKLCVKVTLDGSTADALKNKSLTDVSFTFTAKAG